MRIEQALLTQVQQSAPENQDWNNIIGILTRYVQSLYPGSIADLQTILNGVEPYIQEAGPATQQAFSKLQADFAAYCQNPSIGTDAMMQDINLLAANPPTLSDDDFRQATIELISQMYNTVGQGGNIQDLYSLFSCLIFSSQLPQPACSNFFSLGNFLDIFYNYSVNQNPSTEAALQASLQQIEGIILGSS